MNERKIIWIGRFRGYSGFAVASREYFLVTKQYFNNLYLASLEVLEDADPLKQYSISLPIEDSALKIVNHLPITEPDAEVYFSVFEYDRIPDTWIDIFNRSKLIMTQSNFCKNIFSKFIDEPLKIHVIPYILPNNFFPEGKKIRYFPENIFIFGSVFEWVARKVPERMIQAFVEEFKINEPVRLILKTSHPEGKDIKKILREITNDSRIILLDQQIKDIAEFYRGLDAYISCTAGEGFGQTLFEAMSCGIPTIGSNHSGNLDFMNNDNSFLVDVHDWSLIPNSEFRWKLPKISSIREKMRYLFENKNSDLVRSKVKNAIKTISTFKREEIGLKIAKLIKKIL